MLQSDSIGTSPLKLRSGVLAAFGVALPYAVVALSIFLFRGHISNHEFYTSGRLKNWDAVSGWISLGAFVFGLALCWPFVRQLFAASSTRSMLVAGIVIFFVLQFLGVYGFRVALYVGAGGIL
jgi:hypothetical protein